MKYIDNFLNTITMYRLVLYCLIILLAIASVLSAFDVLSFSPHALIVNIAVILSVGFLTDRLLARIFRVNPNIESVCITALILSLLITPSLKTQTLIFAVVAVLLAISSKYLLAPLKKHLFNPAAFGITSSQIRAPQGSLW